MDWLPFITAYLAFLLTHAIPVRPPVKPWLVDRLGARGFTLAYSALSLAVLAWLIVAAGQAPFVPLWDWAPWQSHVAMTVMLPVCLLLALSLGRPNPFSFGGPATGFDPDHPGLVAHLRHPLLVALALWAGAHTLANGDLAHVLLFGGFAGFALLGQHLLDRRRQRDMGAEWHALRARMRNRPAPRDVLAMPRRQLVLRLMAGALLYTALLEAHPHVIGVAVLP